MSLILNESLVLAKTRCQDLKSVIKLNCWGSGIKDVSLVRQLTNVEVIGLSCNEITSLEDFAYCTKLKELILRKNKISNIAEVAHLQALPRLTSLWLGENPCAENTHNYRKVVLKALPNLTSLDNQPVTREELQEIEELGNDIYEEIPYDVAYNNSNDNTSNGRENVGQPDPAAQVNEVFDTNPQHDNNNIQSEFQYTSEPIHFEATNEPTQQLSTSNNENNNSTSHNRAFQQVSRSSRYLSQQGSYSSNNINSPFNGSNNNNNNISNNNNSFLPKGGKSRSGNILSAILCLVKELDYTGCEVVQTALHCRMEETSD